MKIKRLINTVIYAVSCVALLSSASCQKKSDGLLNLEVPDTVVTAQKMLPLLVELHQAEARIANARLTANTARALYTVVAAKIMKEQGIDTSMYQKSLRYYSRHPAVFQEMYSQVLDSLKTRQALATESKKEKEGEAAE